METGLYLAATPIGNLGDITLRVLEALAATDLVACEDTRVTGKLLKHFSIRAKMIAYHEHNAEVVGPKILEKIRAGESVVLVTDAGTPIVSDPGSRLVSAAREENLNVVPLPGASAPLAALVASGLTSETWTFHGFLPSKSNARNTIFEACANSSETHIFFESPNRLIKTLEEMKETLGGDREVCVARELTKMYEQITTCSIEEMLSIYKSRAAIKGEIVLLVSPVSKEHSVDPEALLVELLSRMSVSKAAAEASALTGIAKRELYQRALRLKTDD